MGSITLRVRSIAWFVTVAVLSSAVTLMFVDAWRVDAAPGDDDSTYVPITPCRLADTRPEPNRVGPAGTLSANDTTTFQATGTNGDCTIPADAVGLSLNVTALGATTSGDYLTFWPDGERPTAASLNPAPGEPPTPNAVTTQLSSAGAFNVYNFVGTVDVVIDVAGYYTKASLQQLASRLAAVEAKHAAEIIAVEAAVSALDAAQPFAVTDRNEYELLGTDPTVVLSVTITAPVAGQITINYSGQVYEDTSGTGVECSITTGDVVDPDYEQSWEAGTPPYLGTLAGTRMFDLAAGATGTYKVVCNNPYGGTSDFANTTMTTVFTPAP